MLSQIFGNLAAAFIIGSLSQVTYFYIMAGVALSSSLIFIALKNPKGTTLALGHEGVQTSTNDRLTVLTESDMKVPSVEKDTSLMATYKNVFRVIRDPKMIKFIP